LPDEAASGRLRVFGDIFVDAFIDVFVDVFADGGAKRKTPVQGWCLDRGLGVWWRIPDSNRGPADYDS